MKMKLRQVNDLRHQVCTQVRKSALQVYEVVEKDYDQ